MRRTTVLAAALSALMVTGLSGQDGLRLDLNIPAQRLVVIDGGRVVKSYPVSVGLPGHATPTGEFRVRRAEWNPWWHPPERAWARNKRVTPPGPNNPMGRVKLFFAPYYYLHGTPHVDDLGSPASHGCVRMRNSDAIELATMLHNRAEPTVPPTAIRGILARPRQTRWVEFRAPVALTIRYDPVVVRNGELRIYRDFYKHGAVHSEAVYQALIDAGYDANSIDRSTVRSLVRRATASRETLIVPVEEAFAGISGGPSREQAGR